MHLKPLVGADPELFLETEATGAVRSAIERVGGSKRDPLPLGRDGFFVQEDNVAAEFNIPPARDVDQFVESIVWAKQRIADNVAPMGLRLRIAASAVFPDYELLDPKALSFGCDPDFNAWTGKMNPRPHAVDKNLRSCGGHIHVGLMEPSVKTKFTSRDFVRAMDLYLGVPSVLMDDDLHRRQLYGKAGAHRITPYGFEYRTLSNFWIKTPSLSRWAYEQTIRAYEWVLSYKDREMLDHLFNAIGTEIQKCIDESDVFICQQLAADYNLEIVD